jgi:transposase
MSQKPIAMEQLQQIIQLQKDVIPIHEMACRIGISRNSIHKYLALIAGNTTTPIAVELIRNWLTKPIRMSLEHSEKKLEQLIRYFTQTASELTIIGVTCWLLWHKYLQQHPDGYWYSQYCLRLNEYLTLNTRVAI